MVWNGEPFAGVKELLKEKKKRQIGIKKKETKSHFHSEKELKK